MKFRKDEAEAILQVYRKSLSVLKIKNVYVKEYFKEITHYYFHQEKDSVHGKVQIEKGKYLLNSNSQEALDFQKELVIDMINRMLALPDEKLALTDRQEASQFMLESHNDVCLLLTLDQFMGPEYNTNVLADFDIPQDIVDVLKHKRALLDAEKKELPDPKYDRYILNGAKVKIAAKVTEDQVPNRDTMLNNISGVRTQNGVPDRDSFDDFMEAMMESPSADYKVEKEKNIPNDVKKEMRSLLGLAEQAKGQFSALSIEYGKNAMIYRNDMYMDSMIRLIEKVREFPQEVIESIPKDTAAGSVFMNIYTKLRNADVVKNNEEDLEQSLIAAAKRQTEKTLYANAGKLRRRLDLLGYSRSITDQALVAGLCEFMDAHPKKNIDDALTSIAYRERTAAEELAFQTRKIKSLASLGGTSEQWSQVASGIAKIEILKSMPQETVLDIDDLEKKSVELLKSNPNISLNVFMHDKQIIEGYFENPGSLLDNFNYSDPEIRPVDLEAAYAEIRNNAINDGIDVDYLPPDKIIDHNVTPLARKSYMLSAKEARTDVFTGLTEEVLKAHNYTAKSGWARLHTYFVDIPNSKEDVVKNYEFITAFENNEMQEDGHTFRQKVLLDSIETLKNLDVRELLDLTDEDIIDKWPTIKKKWNLAFVAEKDLLGACNDEKLVISEDDRNKITFINTQATYLFQSIQMRKEKLCDPYSPIVADLDKDQLDEIDVMPSFEQRFFGIQKRGFDGESIYNERSARLKALTEAGLTNIENAGATLTIYNEKGTGKETPFDFLEVALATDGKIFSVKAPGKDEIFYHFDAKNNAYFKTGSLVKMNEFLKPHDVSIHIDSDKTYSDTEYVDAFTDAYEQLMDKVKLGANVTASDIARVLAMQSVNNSLRDHMENEDEYSASLKAFVSEDYIKANMDAIMASPAFDKFIEKMGGLDEQGFIDVQDQKEYLNFNALKDYQDLADQAAKEEQAAVSNEWNKPLSAEESKALMDKLTEQIKADVHNVHPGYETPERIRTSENLFRMALLKKNIDSDLQMSQKDIYEKAHAINFDPKCKGEKGSVLADENVTRAAGKVLDPPQGEYSWLDRIYKLMDRYEEMKSPDFETPDMFFERKYAEENKGPVNEKAKEALKKDFIDLYGANNLIRFANPEKAVTDEELWKLMNDKELQSTHETAVEQINRRSPDTELHDSQAPSKTYLARSFSYNINYELTGPELIKREKAKILLGDNTPEALDFQREYVVEMINKMLALPDEKLAMHGTPESLQYYSDNYRDIYMLFEVENFMGGASLSGGVRNDFDIPDEVVEVIRHKKNLAQNNIITEDGILKGLSDKNYKVFELYKNVDQNDLGIMQAVGGAFSASKDVKNLIGQKLFELCQNSGSEDTAARPDKKYDGFRLDPSSIKIKARTNYNETIDDVVGEFDEKVNEEAVTRNYQYVQFTMKLADLKKDFAEQKTHAEMTKVFKDMEEYAKAYSGSLVTREHPFNKLSEDDKACVKYANRVAAFCRKNALYHTVKDKVFKLETELGIRDHSLDLELNPEKDYSKEEYKSIVSANRSKVQDIILKDIEAQRKTDPDTLARLAVLDGINKKISDPECDAAVIKSFLDENYVQMNIDKFKENAQFKSLVAKNEPLDAEFVKSDISSMLIEEIRSSKNQVEAQKVKKPVLGGEEPKEKNIEPNMKK